MNTHRDNKVFVRWLSTLAVIAALAGVVQAQGKPAAKEQPDQPKIGPAAQAVLESNAQTPAELLRAVILLTNLDHGRLAQPFLQRLLKANLDADALADLGERFKTPALLRLALAESLAPEGKDFADAVMTALDRRTRDPKRLAALVEQLVDPSPAARHAAQVDLLQAKTDAVTFLITALAKSDTPERQQAVREGLVAMGSMAVDPLIAALDCNDPVLKTQVMRALAGLKVRTAAPFLVGPAAFSQNQAVRNAARDTLLAILGAEPSREAAARTIEKRVHRYLDGPPPLVPSHEGVVNVWDWDEASGGVVQRSIAAEDVGVLLAAQLTPELYAFDPNNSKYRRLHLISRLEAAKIRAGYDKPLPTGAGTAAEEAARSGIASVEDVLREAIRRHRIGAAIAAVEILGKLGDPRVLNAGGRQSAPLAQAAKSNDRRLRFAAVAAILELDPRQPFAGSSAVPEALGYFAGTGSSRRAVVGFQRTSRGQDLVGMLTGLGYEADVATGGKRLVKAALATTDLDLILVEAAISHPGLREVVYELRRDPRTAGIPIGILATLDDLPRAQTIAKDDPLTEAFPHPHDERAMEFQVNLLNQRAGRHRLSDEERFAQATAALGWIAEHAGRRRSIHNVRNLSPAVEVAAYQPDLTQAAVKALAQLGTASSQRVLADLASQAIGRVEDRRAAAEAFGASVAKHGILLTTAQIERQYEIYNASETADKDTQLLRGQLLDVIEAPTKAVADQEKAKQP